MLILGGDKECILTWKSSINAPFHVKSVDLISFQSLWTFLCPHIRLVLTCIVISWGLFYTYAKNQEHCFVNRKTSTAERGSVISRGSQPLPESNSSILGIVTVPSGDAHVHWHQRDSKNHIYIYSEIYTQNWWNGILTQTSKEYWQVMSLISRCLPQQSNALLTYSDSRCRLIHSKDFHWLWFQKYNLFSKLKGIQP